MFHLAKSQGLQDTQLGQWRKELERAPNLVKSSLRAAEQSEHDVPITAISPELEERAMARFLSMYRSGELGKFVVDALDVM